MPGASIFSRFRTAARRFAGAKQGNIAVIFGIAAVPIISFVGAAIDYTRANNARTQMQAALDSVSLMLSKDLTDGIIQPSDINAKAQTYFAALFNNNDAKAVTVTATYTASTGIGSTIVVNGSGNVTTDFLQVAGFPKLNFGTSATSAWGNVRMRVAMALDVTGSMAADGKMPALQKAAKSLIDQLSALAKNPGDIYISIVPFAKDVNMGAAFYEEPWIDWSLWEAANGTCSSGGYSKKSSCENNGKTWTPANHNTWTGCFTDRDQDFDIKNTTPTVSDVATLFPAEEYGSGSSKYCKTGNNPYLQPIKPLTYDWASLKTLIDNLQPTGNTNQGIGMAWAWMTLGTGEPFKAPAKDPNYQYKDAIILMSDGVNTQNRWYSNASDINARQAKLCANAKAQPNNITIYAVQVDTGGDGQQSVMKNCASSSDKYFHVTDPNQTLTAFTTIGTSLSKLRVAK
jgi:Flp pilus assembly protein TadG